ncbi:MAG: sensor histidine kinase [Sulfurospirillaceae bacterium]|nr:sensor histidine kinase [Sulfurospirillaceae bacterium]
MKLLLGCIFAVLTALHAQTIVLNDDFEYTKASSSMEYALDVNNSFNINLLDQAQWQPMLSSNLGGFNEYPTWTKCTIKNNSQIHKKFIIKNPRAGMDEIDVYIVRNKETTHSPLGNIHSMENRNIPHLYSAEVIELEANEEVQIISRLSNKIGSTEGEWEIFARSYFLKFTIFESLWWGLFIGVYLALFFYTTPILIASNDKILGFFFSLYVMSSIGYQLATNGILYSFGLYGHTVNILTLLFGILFLIFTVFVVLRFLKMTHHKGFLSYTLRLILFLLLLESLIAIVCFFEPRLMRIFSLTIVATTIPILLIWFLMLKDLFFTLQDKVFQYIFIGFTAIFVAHTYQVLITIGFLQINSFSIYCVSFGSMFEMYFFALGISKYIEQIQDEKIKNKQLLDFQMRFASIGRVIGNISHQWKMPMIRAGSLLTHIEALIHFKNKRTLEEIEAVIPQIRSHFVFMQNTIDEFYSLYSKNTNKVEFKLLDVINDVWRMLSTKASAYDMKLYIKDLQDTQLFSFEYSFSHVIIILIDNALDAMKAKNIQHPKIVIDISHNNEIITIIIEDNCGGIEQKPIESIFDSETSNKRLAKTTGGLGLSIVKLLINEKFGGTISASNTHEGAKFVLLIPMASKDQ